MRKVNKFPLKLKFSRKLLLFLRENYILTRFNEFCLIDKNKVVQKKRKNRFLTYNLNIAK